VHHSPQLFVVVMEAISRELRIGLPWELLYADGLVLLADSEIELIKKSVEVWRGKEGHAS